VEERIESQENQRSLDEELLLIARLAKQRVEDENGCWNWTGARTADGYGVLWVSGPMYVHRLSATVFLGFDPGDERFVLHQCDNRRCFNPNHLSVGTHGDNMEDARRKGKMAKKLRAQDVIEIRRQLPSHTHRELAATYNVSPTTIGQIARGETWRHVTEPAPEG
jgi:hypothetical protein